MTDDRENMLTRTVHKGIKLVSWYLMTKWQNTDNAKRLSGVVALGSRGTGFIRIPALPLFYWVATLASCLLTLPPQSLSSKKLGYKREYLDWTNLSA